MVFVIFFEEGYFEEKLSFILTVVSESCQKSKMELFVKLVQGNLVLSLFDSKYDVIIDTGGIV